MMKTNSDTTLKFYVGLDIHKEQTAIHSPALYNAIAVVAAQKKTRSHAAWTEARSQSRAQGGVGPGS